MTDKITMRERFDESYEEIIIGFISELKDQNVDGRLMGKELAKITELMRCYNA